MKDQIQRNKTNQDLNKVKEDQIKMKKRLEIAGLKKRKRDIIYKV